MNNYLLILPEVLLLLGALIAMFSDVLCKQCSRVGASIGFLFALGAAVSAACLPLVGDAGPFGSLLVYDELARFARVSIAGLTAVWLLWTAGRIDDEPKAGVSLVLFATVGALLLCEARELITVFVSLELSTLPLYVLIGYKRKDIRGLEGALKYFLLSMLTTLVTLYGMSFIYGLTGTTFYGVAHLPEMNVGILVVLGLALIGVFAKLSAAPFHFWAPDAYDGATPWAVSYVATVPKIAGVIMLARFIEAYIAPGQSLMTMIAVVAAASMIVGNLGALVQKDVRRMMAYSSIAHAGYLLIGMVIMTKLSVAVSVIYIVVYSVATMGIMLVCAEEGPAVGHFNGLASRRPFAAWATVIMLLSLIGIPPLAGFFGKLYLFTTALDHHMLALVIIAIVMSVVSAAYYLRIVYAMFFGDPQAFEATYQKPALAKSVIAPVAVALCLIATVGIGLGFEFVLSTLTSVLA